MQQKFDDATSETYCTGSTINKLSDKYKCIVVHTLSNE